MAPRTDCSSFTGYKPCGKNSSCDNSCVHYKKRGSQILLIHLGALGAVVRSTALIASIHRKYPGSQITWVTQKPADQLLKGHPDLHRVLTLSESDLLVLSVLQFDVAFVVDKSIEATGVLKKTFAKEVFGFAANGQGVIGIQNSKANELWQMGLSDELKLKINQKTELQLVTEALELEFQKDEYNLPLTLVEKDLQFQRRMQWSDSQSKTIIGLNTGCAPTIQAKKLSVENHRELLRRLLQNKNYNVVLLGGPEDTQRNLQIASGFTDVILSSTTLGLRDGLISVGACDVVVTGDSLGMHMAISQKIPTIAWFGPTCAVEIELFGRGEKIVSEAGCGPCWKRSCHKPVMCYDLVNLDEIIRAVRSASHQSSHSDSLSRGSASSDSTFDLA